jgi:hypothetical protein
MGAWLLSINGFPVASRDKYVELFLSTAASTRTVHISRAANKDKENSQHTVATVVPTKPPSPPAKIPLRDWKTLLGMTAKQLKEAMAQQHLSANGTKDDMLQRVGIPAKQWKQWRGMTILQLKPLLQQRAGLTVKGTKHEMLTRLGVPVGFEETKQETWGRQNKRANEGKQKAKAGSNFHNRY